MAKGKSKEEFLKINPLLNGTLTKEEAKEISAKGGRNSGAKRKKLSLVKDIMKYYLSMDSKDEEANKIKDLFPDVDIDEKFMTTIAILGRIKKTGSINDLEKVMILLGEAIPESVEAARVQAPQKVTIEFQKCDKEE